MNREKEKLTEENVFAKEPNKMFSKERMKLSSLWFLFFVSLVLFFWITAREVDMGYVELLVSIVSWIFRFIINLILGIFSFFEAVSRYSGQSF